VRKKKAYGEKEKMSSSGKLTKKARGSDCGRSDREKGTLSQNIITEP
jgi:hypothetical protein